VVVQNAEGEASGSWVALLATLPLEGWVVLLAVAALLLGKLLGRSGRRALARWVGRQLKRLTRALVRLIRTSVWAARLRMPLRLAIRLQPERWRQMVADRQLVGLKRGRVRRTAFGVAIRVTLNGKLDLSTVVSRIGQLETGLGLRRGSIRVEPDEYAHRATLHVVLRDPLKKGVPWVAPVGPVSITDPARLSLSPFGEWTEINLRQRILVVGASGSGKSSVQRVLAASVILAEDADLEVWDLKQGTESQHYEGKAVRRITTATECAARIDELVDVELPRRAALLKARKSSTWEPTSEHRDLVVMVDEGAALIRELDEDHLKRLFTFLEQARAYGIFLWWATQYPKSTNLPTELRSQMSAVIALRMQRQSESRVVFEDLTREGWTPHRLPGPGWLLISDADHSEPEPTRAAWLSEAEFRKLTPPAPVAPVQVTLPARPVVDETIGLGRPDLRVIPGGKDAKKEAPSVDALRAALRDAGPEGVSVPDLEESTGGSRSWVHKWLTAWLADGSVVRVSRGRYRAADATDATGTE